MRLWYSRHFIFPLPPLFSPASCVFHQRFLHDHASSYPFFLWLQEVASECQNMNWGTFKPVLTDALIDHLQPIQVYISFSYAALCGFYMQTHIKFLLITGSFMIYFLWFLSWASTLVCSVPSILRTTHVDFSSPNLQERYREITSDSGHLDKVLAEGASRATEIAESTLKNVYQAMGFLRRWRPPPLWRTLFLQNQEMEHFNSLDGGLRFLRRKRKTGPWLSILGSMSRGALLFLFIWLQLGGK